MIPRKCHLRTALTLSMIAWTLWLNPQFANATEPAKTIMRIEEDWEMQVVEPSPRTTRLKSRSLSNPVLKPATSTSRSR